MDFRRNLKLSPRFYGPFRISQKIEEVACKLDLPERSLIHLVFHVSQLKQKLGRTSTAISHLPSVDFHGVVQPEPEDILDLRSHKVNSCTVVEVLVQWNGQKKGGSIMGGFSSSKVYLLIPYGQGVLNEWGSGIGMRKRKSELFKKGSIESKGVKEALQGLIPEELRKVKV
jgi:hypothetical protein